MSPPITEMTLDEVVRSGAPIETRFAEYARRLASGEASANDVRRAENMNPAPEPDESLETFLDWWHEERPRFADGRRRSAPQPEVRQTILDVLEAHTFDASRGGRCYCGPFNERHHTDHVADRIVAALRELA